MRKIDKIIIHCTATPEGLDVTIDQIRRWHKERGFSDIGYHYVIYLDGSVHEGRSIDKVGAHCKGHNSNSIGIAHVGGLDKKNNHANTMTPRQEESLFKLIQELKTKYPSIKVVLGHNDFAATACPCFNVSRWLYLKKKWLSHKCFCVLFMIGACLFWHALFHKNLSSVNKEFSDYCIPD